MEGLDYQTVMQVKPLWKA